MALFSQFTSQCLKVAAIGFTSVFMALPVAAQSANDRSIAEISVSNESFDTFSALLVRAGFLAAFDGTNGKNFTVFVPTDKAFSRLPKGTIETLLKPENKDLLNDVLAYHVIGGTVTSNQLSSGSVKSKAMGLPLRLNVGRKVMVNGATVTTADIAASNGVIHAIDTVLIPNR